ncbi:eukaryotic translation initiation factor 3 subunit H-like [Varroa jacobsoni]|uniref:Eukaryotic translation initiation factor 3 subunit H n=1 Tax=Varroa destructor TaxID=109461 RepID=A0A7M7KLY1_VARDE|nr:eukaryotic translation initiation factor 3 subunit H-like [Varroa destructor]XP_022699835.1 eukaryotic translation initiation factor 3 subunit H-like [Varroa jacobsoni]
MASQSRRAGPGGLLETGSARIEYVQVDGLVAMKIARHSHEEAGGLMDFAQGVLLGMVDGRGVEVTNCFPYPRHGDEEEYEESEYQMEMLRQMRAVNIDHLTVGWYQASPFGSFFTRPLLESQFSYQENIEESILLVYDPIKAQRGFFSLRAFRLTEAAFALCRDGEYTLDSFKNCKCSYSDLFEEIPVRIRNSHLINLLQCELEELVPSHAPAGKQFLDMSTAFSLERQLQATMECVDNLNQETNKLLNHQRQVMRQQQQKTLALAKRAQENAMRKQRNEPPLPDDDIHKQYKPILAPARLDSVLLAGQVEAHCNQMAKFSTQNLAKLFMSDALQKKDQ